MAFEQDGELLERFEQRTRFDIVYKNHFGLSVEKRESVKVGRLTRRIIQ